MILLTYVDLGHSNQNLFRLVIVSLPGLVCLISPLHLGAGGQYHSMVDMREDQILGSCGLGTSSLWVFDGI